MRALTTSQERALSSGLRGVWARVEVLGLDAEWRDLSDLLGVDWLESVEWGEDLDNPIGDLSLQVRRDFYRLSTSPTMAGSRLNAGPGGVLLDLAREIRAYVAVGPPGASRPPPSSSSWVLVFHGEIQEVDAAGPSVDVTAADLGIRLQAQWVEEPRIYGAEGGRLLHLVIQDLLDEWAPGVTLYTPSGTGAVPIHPSEEVAWALPEWEQPPQPLFAVIQELVRQCGHVCRYRFHEDTGAFQLVLYRPDREASSPVWTFQPWAYEGFAEAARSLEAIRNAGEVGFYDAAELVDGRPTLKVATGEVAASIARYGRRWFSITEEATSQIQSLAEAGDLLSAILADLSEPKESLTTAGLLLWWPAQLGDLVRFTPNGATADTALDAAVSRIRHRIGPGEAESTLGLRGQPAAYVDVWLEAEARPGVAPWVDRVPPAPPPEVILEPLPGGVRVEIPWSARSHLDLSHYEIHVSGLPDFTPDDSTLWGQGIGSVTIGDLPPGEEVHVRVVPVKRNGIRGLPTADLEVLVGQGGSAILGEGPLASGSIFGGAYLEDFTRKF